MSRCLARLGGAIPVMAMPPAGAPFSGAQLRFVRAGRRRRAPHLPRSEPDQDRGERREGDRQAPLSKEFPVEVADRGARRRAP